MKLTINIAIRVDNHIFMNLGEKRVEKSEDFIVENDVLERLEERRMRTTKMGL